MNNSNTSAIFRSLIIYAICVPLAIYVGYSLGDPLDKSSLTFYGVLVGVLVSPLLLRWHREVLVFTWSAAISVFFLPGAPNLWLVMVCISLTISVMERILSSNAQFIRLPKLTWPLMIFLFVVFFTAELTGGIGLKSMGSSSYGGKKYVLLFISIASYFAITARPIPPEKAKLFLLLYFLGPITTLVGSLYPYTPSFLSPIFYVFPPDIPDPTTVNEVHYPALGCTGLSLYGLLMAMYGPRDIFLGRKIWKHVLLALAVFCILMGGFRSTLLMTCTSFSIMFFMQKLHKTPVIFVMILLGASLATAVIPFARHLPWTIQRALSFLPLDLDEDPRKSADDSTDWRLAMWTALLPQVPPHLLLGKGLSFSQEDFNEMMNGSSALTGIASMDASQNSLALSGDYHNGMLSLIIPFGIWGVISVAWFLIAGGWVLYRNATYCPDHLRVPCLYLFSVYTFMAVSFLSCFGGLQIASDLAGFVGVLGLSVALNNGVCSPEPKPAPSFRTATPFRSLPRPRPAFIR